MGKLGFIKGEMMCRWAWTIRIKVGWVSWHLVLNQDLMCNCSGYAEAEGGLPALCAVCAPCESCDVRGVHVPEVAAFLG